jgi:hypothetical protein
MADQADTETPAPSLRETLHESYVNTTGDMLPSHSLERDDWRSGDTIRHALHDAYDDHRAWRTI